MNADEDSFIDAGDFNNECLSNPAKCQSGFSYSCKLKFNKVVLLYFLYRTKNSRLTVSRKMILMPAKSISAQQKQVHCFYCQRKWFALLTKSISRFSNKLVVLLVSGNVVCNVCKIEMVVCVRDPQR